MSTAGDAQVLGPCSGCGYPVRQGDARLERPGGPPADPLLHRTLCVPRDTALKAPGRPA